MKEIAVIINKNSRMYKRSFKKIQTYFSRIDNNIVKVWYTEKIEDLSRVAIEIKKQNIDIVAPLGGDGTLHQVISEFAKVFDPLPQFLILKAGTMNNVATSIGLKGDAFSILDRAMNIINAGNEFKTVKLNTMKINNKYCFLFGNGFTADFLNVYYKMGKSYIKVVVLILSSILKALIGKKDKLFKGFTGKIVCDGKKLPFNNVLGTLAGTVETVGMGFYPLYNARKDLNSFQILVSAISPSKLALNVMKIKKGRPIIDKNFYDVVIKKLELISNDKFYYTMDGDLYQADKTCIVEAGVKINFVII